MIGAEGVSIINMAPVKILCSAQHIRVTEIERCESKISEARKTIEIMELAINGLKDEIAAIDKAIAKLEAGE